MTEDILTQAHLKEELHYNPDTGVFTWCKSRPGVKIGNIAGHIDLNGYRTIGLFRVVYQSHRLAWLYVYGEFPEDQIDHINHIRDDNRIINLRSVTNTENQRNTTKRSNNTSGHVGVHWHNLLKKWRATIGVDGISKCLGNFSDIADAIKARKQAEIEYGFHENHGI